MVETILGTIMRYTIARAFVFPEKKKSELKFICTELLFQHGFLDFKKSNHTFLMKT